jgi:hypothetical protein
MSTSYNNNSLSHSLKASSQTNLGSALNQVMLVMPHNLTLTHKISNSEVESGVFSSSSPSGISADLFGHSPTSAVSVENIEQISQMRAQQAHQKILGGVAKRIASIHHGINYGVKKGKEQDFLNIAKPKTNNKCPSANTISTNASSSNSQTYKLPCYQKLLRIFEKVGEIEDSVFIVALIYLDRILKEFSLDDGEFLKGMYSTCVLLAHKFLVEEEYWPVDEFSKMVGVSEFQIKKWELQILDCLAYKLFVSPQQFD